MPLNIPKNYAYVPTPVGPTRIVTRSARRSRLYAGGTFFRSVRRGQDANLLAVGLFEVLSPSRQGVLVVQDRVLKPADQVETSGTSAQVELFSLNLNWNEELRFEKVGAAVRANLYGISWQIGGGEVLLQSYGEVRLGRIFTIPGKISCRVQDLDFPDGALITFKPRVKRYPLVEITVSDPDTLTDITGWDIDALRLTVNTDTTAWVTMPVRAGNSPGAEPPGSDAQDEGEDDAVGSSFGLTNMTGGDGLPPNPSGLNTGPDRTLLHLNYSEVENGSLGVLNHIYEWAGESATIGSWQRYS